VRAAATPAAQSPPRCTKCNSPPINSQCTNFISFDAALQLPLNSKGLNIISTLLHAIQEKCCLRTKFGGVFDDCTGVCHGMTFDMSAPFLPDRVAQIDADPGTCPGV